MKKLNKLFAILIAVLGVTTLKAQTDVTDQYLTNADFENSPIFDGTSLGKSGTNASPTSGSTLISGATNVYEISGWTNMTTDKSDFARVFTMPYNTTLYVKSNGDNGGQAVAAPANGSSIKENNSSLLFVEANWCHNATLGIKQDVTLPAGVYELNFDSYVTTNIQNGTSLCGVQVGSTQIYKWPTATDTWTNNSITFALTSEQSVTISMGYKKSSNVGGGASPFLFVDNIRLLHKPFTDVTESDPVDFTSKVSNTKEAWAGASETPGYDGVTMVAVYKSSDWIGDALSQTVNGLPAGNYKMEAYCQAHSAWDTDAAAEGVTGYTYLCANEYKLDVPIRNADNATTKQLHTFEKISITDGSLKISVVNEKLAANWISVYVKSLTFLGPDKSLEEESFNSNIEALNALNAENVPTAFAAEINNMIYTYGDLDASEMKLAELFTANEEIRKFIATYNILADLYANLKSFITTCESIKENSSEAVNGAKGTFANAIATATANAETATTADAINEQYNTLEEAKNIYVKNADPINGMSFDYTFLIANPSFESGNTDGWNHPSAYDAGAKENSNGDYTINGADGKYIFNIWNNSSIAYYIQQTVTGLPSGLYTLKAIVASDANHVITLTAGDKATDVTITSDKSTATEVVVENVVCSSGSLLIKASSANWFKADHFRLYYNGFDAATAQESVKSLKSQAEALVGSPMDADAAAALNAAIAGADATKTTRNELTSMIDALNAAIEAVENWRRDYSEAKALLVAALERFEADFNDGANGALRFMPAEAWNNILNAVAEAAKAKDVLDSYDGFETAANNLHAAMDAVYASYIKYDMLENLTSLIGNADCTANDAWPGSGRSTIDDQHWSGQKRTYFAQNHENGAARSQTITLPKDGTYLLKVAVRAVEAASYAEILINGVSYKTVGAHGRTGGTIATDGTEWESIQAGIDAGKTFANNNQGYGWVYTYIYFDAKAGENTIAINLSNFNSSREANCGGMEIYYLRPNYTVVEDGVVEYYGEFDEVTGTAYATHDVTNATLKENSIDVTANPNTFIIANENQVSNENNVIVDGTAASLVLNEGYAFYAATNFTATAATYSREFTKDTWLTVCLPFAYDVPENVEVETLSTVDADTKTFVFNKVDVMEANKPYIIKNGTEKNALFTELSNAEVKATPDAMSVSAEEGNAEFIGTYTTVTTDALMENGTYDILFFGTDGQLYYLSDGINQNVITIDPFRAYIRLPKGIIDWENGAAQAIARHGEGTTGIENSTLNAQPSTVIYDLMGRKVTNMVKGNMYIVNGKKVIK